MSISKPISRRSFPCEDDIIWEAVGEEPDAYSVVFTSVEEEATGAWDGMLIGAVAVEALLERSATRVCG